MATAVATDKWSKEFKDVWLKVNQTLLKSSESMTKKNLILIQEVKALRAENTDLSDQLDVLQNAVDDFMASTSIAQQDLTASAFALSASN